ncbi:unnamed protein product [Phytophthora fragariaefolia]|uniref:Unnamed protein product n=1 Tax=Phytophthora fragariaefolia TaxID=1490495 RepID=A0A9W6XMT3_9STRA|nr:unnamed protein product [Phytophthora fragariaefolia]
MKTGEVTYSTSSGTEQIRELSASEAMDNQALRRTSEPIQAGSTQVGETILPVVIESGDDRTVVPQRAVSPRSGEIACTRTDHPCTCSVEAHTHGTTIGNRSKIQSHNEGHPTSVDASRSQADMHRQPTQTGGLLKVAGITGRVSALEVPSTCALPSEEDVVLDYLRTSGMESRQDHVKCDRDLPSYERFVYALLAIKYVTVPPIYKQAIASGEAAQLGKAVDSEIQSHEDNETWVLVLRPKGLNVLKNGWVYVIKYKSDGSVDRFKARLVIKGFLQKYGIDYTEIFVVRMEILRLLLALAAAMDWEVEQLDVKTAFLNAYLDEEIYMEQPVGYVQRGKEDHVCVLRKSLYGLKQAPRV